MLTWLLIEWLHEGKPTVLGAATAAVAGLVSITPACAFVTPGGSILVGIGGAAICYVAVGIEEATSHTVTVTVSPPPVNDLSPILSGDDLMLTWSPPAGSAVSRYVVYRDTDPVFLPGPADSIGDTTDTTYIDAGAGNTPDFSQYYAVKAVNDLGQKSGPSNIVGEYDVALGNVK